MYEAGDSLITPGRAGRHDGRRGARTNLAAARQKGQETIQKAADAFAANVLPIIREVQAGGVTSFQAIADALNARGMRARAAGK